MDDTAGYVSMLESVRDRGRAAEWPRIRWALLANTTQDPMRPFLKQLCYDIGYEADVWIGGYDTALQDAASQECASVDVVVIALRLQLLAPALVDRFAEMSAADVENERRRVLEYVSAVLAAVRSRSRAPILVHTFETPLSPQLGMIDYRSPAGQVNTIRRLNLELAGAAAGQDGVFIVDVDAIRARLTGSRFEDSRTWHIGRVAYSRHAMRAIADEYMRVVRAVKGRSRKCLVVDADGTLWGGVAGEDGVAGIRIGHTFPGSAFYDFQHALLALRSRGVLLALCSKNDPDLVAEVFAARAADMPLRLDHFAAVRVNWSDKAQNIREIAVELNIGLDSLVYMDDSAFETALVSELVPEVHTIRLPEDPVEYRDALASCTLFDALTFSDEDRRRTDMYAAERQRRDERASSTMTVDDYLRGLEMEVAIDSVDAQTIPRAAQLTQKTNQFNLTTKRYSEGEIQAFAAAADCDVYVARLRDRLGDSGVVGLAIVRHQSGQSDVDTLLMSCRALGRGVEDALLAACIRSAAQRGCRELIGRYIATAKNARAADFYETRGFTDSGDGVYRRSIGANAAGFPAHFKSVVVDGEPVQ